MSNLTKQVVYTALTRITDDRDIIKQAFLSWHSKFADHDMDVFAFVEHIEHFLGLGTGEKKTLMVSMHASASKNASELKQVPAYVMTVGGGSADVDDASQGFSDAKTESKAPHIVLAQAYVNNILAAVRRSNSKHGQEVIEILADEGLPQASSEINAGLKALSVSDLALPSTTTESQCKDLCHELYMLICEVIGPNQTDDVSYKIIAELLNTNEASRYDPRALLE